RAMHVADKNLRLSGASLRTLINTIPDLIWLKDPQGRYLACNTEFERLYGTSEEDILGKDDFTFVSPEKAEFFRHNDQAAAEAGDSRRSEEWVTYASDGHRALLDTRKTPIFDTDGSLIGVLGVGHDITAQRAAEETLRRNTSYQSALLDNFPFLVWLKDTDSRFLAVNRPFAEAAGFTAADDVIGKTDLDIWPGELAEAYRADDRSVMASLQKRSVEEEIVTDSERRWHATYKAPVLDKEGALLGTVGFAMDITPRKTVDLENQHQLAELRRWHEATLGREGRILELKQEINSLLIKHGLTPRYPSAVETPTPVDSQGTAADV
ncbi:MAG: PAS domain-containing protein, partial [Gammaproteobacteria bacterium]|nr:PAS domain-containing protein [Gammaproteobacteria bacterium]